MQICIGIAYIGIEAPVHRQEDITEIEEVCRNMDIFEIAALEASVSTTKSTCLSLALLRGAVDVKTAALCARIEEIKQIMEHGKVEGSHDVDEIFTLSIVAAAKNLVSLKEFG